MRVLVSREDSPVSALSGVGLSGLSLDVIQLQNAIFSDAIVGRFAPTMLLPALLGRATIGPRRLHRLGRGNFVVVFDVVLLTG